MTSETVASARSMPNPEANPVSAWDRFCFSTLRMVVYGMARCLGLAGLYRFGQFFGLMEWVIQYKRRRRFARAVRNHMGDALTDDQVRVACRRHFMRVRCDKIIYLILDMLPPEKTTARWELKNRELLDASLAQGNGVYLAMSHQGAQHVYGLMMVLMGYKVAGVRDRHEGAIRRYMQSMYERRYEEFRGIRIIYSGAFPRDIYRCFQNNYVVGSSLDVHRQREARLKTVEVTLFGRPRKFLVGTVQIALRCKAPIIQIFFVSEKNFRYSAEVMGPLSDRPDGPETPEVLQTIMQRYADNIERFLLAHPEEISRI
jgi:lauroyl/myristoyl acyltransferase